MRLAAGHSTPHRPLVGLDCGSQTDCFICRLSGSMGSHHGPTRVENYFQYKPSLALNIVALVLFILVTIAIAIQTIKYKSRFMWLVVFTGCLEVAGYVCHLIGTVSVNLTAYICNLVFIILAPNFLALANYVCVGKVAEQLLLSGR